MRPTVGQILSGLALGAVAASMLVMPERFLGTDDATVRGLMLQAPAERSVVQAAPIRARRVQVHRSAPIKRSVTVVAHLHARATRLARCVKLDLLVRGVDRVDDGVGDELRCHKQDVGGPVAER